VQIKTRADEVWERCQDLERLEDSVRVVFKVNRRGGFKAIRELEEAREVNRMI
jgi:hypothetical protein